MIHKAFGGIEEVHYCFSRSSIPFHSHASQTTSSSLDRSQLSNPSLKSALLHYTDVIMTTIASQITSLTVVYSTVYSDADQRKHQSSASLAFVWGIHRDRWIPRTKGQLRGKCFHLMTSSWFVEFLGPVVHIPSWDGSRKSFWYSTALLEVWVWITTFIPHLTGHVISYPCCDFKLIPVIKRDTRSQWVKSKSIHFFHFLPEASFGIRVLSLPACVCVSVCLCVRQSWACPCDNSSTVQARITKFGSEM